MYSTVKSLVIPAAKTVGDHYTCAGRKTGKEPDDRIDDTVCGTNRCQSRFTDKISHNNTVNRVIKLLEQVAYKEGKGERDQEFGDIAFGHFLAFR